VEEKTYEAVEAEAPKDETEIQVGVRNSWPHSQEAFARCGGFYSAG